LKAAALAGLADEVTSERNCISTICRPAPRIPRSARPLGVEGEIAGLEAVGPGLTGLAEKIADAVHGLGVGGGIDRGEVLSGDWSTMIILSTKSRPRISAKPSRVSPLQPVEDVVEEGALARARDARDAGEDAQGNPHVDVFEVVLMGVADEQIAVGFAAGSWAERFPSPRSCSGP